MVASTLAYNVVESVVAVWAGVDADSIALFGFGLDSVIEFSAAGIVLWRLLVETRGADAATVASNERFVRRFVGATFLLLALYVTVQAASTLVYQRAPEASGIGIALAVASLAIMPPLAWGKIRVARQIGSEALLAEAKETLACSYLSVILLLGLAANAAVGWWWADPVAALLMVPWLIKEGREGFSPHAADACTK
ncbi:MAG TPA: hypothetical protein ENI87_09510 [bacterium]|nr:hypothetical protein [bacterium]